MVILVFQFVKILMLLGLLLYLTFMTLLIILNSSFEFKLVRFFELNLEVYARILYIVPLLVVFAVSVLVLLPPRSYMNNNNIIHFSILSFTFATRIRFSIVFDNLFWVILGWDGLGVASFRSIVFYMNHVRIRNGIFTLFQNRVGDLFFVVYSVLIIDLSLRGVVTINSVILILGCVVKRAQYPFNSRSPAATSAPTPTSSLVHSSTPVVAGVFTVPKHRMSLLRSNLLIFFRTIRITLRFPGLSWESDIKKLIAYSTTNHVRIMLLFISMGIYKIAYFHLNVHATFKSLMLIRLGYPILTSFHGQDNRIIRISFLNPSSKIIFLFPGVCLAGFPFLSAFFSKDLLIECSFRWNISLAVISITITNPRVRVYYVLKTFIVEKAYHIGLNFVLHRKSRVSIRLARIILIINFFTNTANSIRLEFKIFKLFIYIFLTTFTFVKLEFKISESRLLKSNNPKSIRRGCNVADVLNFSFEIKISNFTLVNWRVFMLSIMLT